MLGTYIPRESLQPINQRYYRDLGADLEQMGTLYDLAPRPEKAALAYTEFVTHGRLVNGTWRPTVARVSAGTSAIKLRSNCHCAPYIPLLFSTWLGLCSNCGCFALP